MGSPWPTGSGPSRQRAGLQVGQRVAPGVAALFEAAAGGELPFGFGGQADRQIPLAGEPLAERDGIEPADTRSQGAWDRSNSSFRNAAKSGVGHLASRHAEGRDDDAVGGTLLIAAVVLAHEKLAAGDCHQIVWVHLRISRIAACVRCRRRGPGRRGPCRRWRIRGASACPPPCGRSPDKCTHRRASVSMGTRPSTKRSVNSTKRPYLVVRNDERVEILADPVGHELDLFPLDEFPFGVGGAAFGLRTLVGQRLQVVLAAASACR